MKKTLCLITAVLMLLLSPAARAGAEVILLPEETLQNAWYQDPNAVLKVGNPTPLQGCFFTTMWGSGTSDLDVQDLLHAYSPVLWDSELGRFRFDSSVVQDMLAMNDADGNRVYLLVLYNDLYYSDGSQITARDYAFSILLQMDPAVAETGGKPADFSWLAGSEEYLNGEAKTVSGLRIIADDILQVTMKAESLPDFYELNRLNIRPYPASEIAPGTKAADDGEGVYLTVPLTADTLRENVLDARIGYLSHPRVVSGPYVLMSYDGSEAKFAVNTYYKGNEEGMIPRIGQIEYSRADNADMIAKLKRADFDLLNKVTAADAIRAGISAVEGDTASFAIDSEARTGLTMIWFDEVSEGAGDLAVRQAIAYCFDRDAFTLDYAGPYGIRTDGYYGLGQWMYRIASGQAEPPARQDEDPAEGEEAAGRDEWEGISLDGLTVYEADTAKAAQALDEAGWNLNEQGEPFRPGTDRIRCKKTENGTSSLNLTMAVPQDEGTREALKQHLADPLREAGIVLTLMPADMETLQDVYDGGLEGKYDMLYLGENFRIILDPELLAPHMENTELAAVRQEVYELAKDTERTEPEDLAGYLRKWVKLQERITETLPLLPVYTNVYFEFYSRKLHQYSIGTAPTWGGAVVQAYISDREDMDTKKQQEIRKELDELEERFGETESP